MPDASITSNPKVLDVFARVNREGCIEITFRQLFELLEGAVAAVRLPVLVDSFDQLGLMFWPGAEVGGFDTPRVVRPRRSDAVAADEARRQIGFGETDRVEFKSSLRFNYKVADSDPGKIGDARVCAVVRDQTLKAICGLYNANGGDLYIGVRDDRHILGIEPDFPLVRKSRQDTDDRDAWQQQVVGDIRERFHEPTAILQRTQFELIEFDAKLVVRIKIYRGEKLAFVKMGDVGSERLRAFVRESVSTRELEPQWIEDYVRTRVYYAR